MLRSALSPIADLFLQRSCPLCDRATSTPLCPNCWHQLQQTATERFPSQKTVLPVLAWGPYQGLIKQAIAALKYHNNPQLAVPLGRALGQRWQQSPLKVSRPPLVVPIPMHAQKQRERGFNQAELLARAFCQQTGLPLAHRGLVRHKATTPQFGLNLEARQTNLKDAFSIGPQLRGRAIKQPVLLLDDIFTTGTTAAMAAAEIRRWGISVCGIAAIAQAYQIEKR